MLVPADPIRQDGADDPRIEVRRGSWRIERREQGEDAGAAAELGRAGGAAVDVGGEAGSAGWVEVVDEVGVDEAARGDMVDRVLGHILYMTGAGEIVALGRHVTPRVGQAQRRPRPTGPPGPGPGAEAAGLSAPRLIVVRTPGRGRWDASRAASSRLRRQ